MGFEIREIDSREDLDELIKLQTKVGGLPPRDTMSPITLSTLAMKKPRVGWVVGAFHEGKMVGFIIALGTATPGLVFGHMLGVLKEHRDSGLGAQLLKFNFEQEKQSGMDRICWTYEPLESRNAHVYITDMGGRVVGYLPDHFHLDSGIHHGLPQDRMLVEVDLYKDRNTVGESMSWLQALETYPLAAGDNMPADQAVLVEIPGDLRRLQAENTAAALKWRMDTRVIFDEYINNRGMIGDEFFTGMENDKRRSLYLLRLV